MNKKQIQNDKGNDGQELLNSNPKYSGRYTAMTEILSNGRKKRGDIYDFNNTGTWLRGFHLQSNLSIFSNGEGNGLKKAFFNGYDNIYGLTKENEAMILKQVKDFIGAQILNNLWE